MRTSLGLFGRRTRSIGLDLGSGFVKLVEVDHSADRPEVTCVAMHPLPAGAIVEGQVMDDGVVCETLKALFRDAGFKGRRVVTAVGGHDVILRKIEMDRMKASEAREVIRWEAEQHIPFDLASVEIDFHILDPGAEGARMEVLLVAAKREVVAGMAKLLTEAGLQPALIDVHAFALHNGFEYNYPEAMQGLVALVDIGLGTTQVSLLEDGVPLLTRDVPFGSGQLRADLQRERGLGAQEAEDVVRGRVRLAGLEPLIGASADQVAVGIERATAFLSARQSGEGVGRIYLCGGGARTPGLPSALAARMNVETNVANPFERIPVRPGAASGVDLEQAAPMLLLSLGLALRSP